MLDDNNAICNEKIQSTQIFVTASNHREQTKQAMTKKTHIHTHICKSIERSIKCKFTRCFLLCYE